MADAPEKPSSLGTFRVIGKEIIRASIVSLQMGTRADGSPNIVQQAGPSERVAVGTELTDVQEHELRAFGDRFQPVDEAARQTVARLSGVQLTEADDDAASAPVNAAAAMPGPAPSSPQDTPHAVAPGPPADELSEQEQRARHRPVPEPAPGRAGPPGADPSPPPVPPSAGTTGPARAATATGRAARTSEGDAPAASPSPDDAGRRRP